MRGHYHKDQRSSVLTAGCSGTSVGAREMMISRRSKFNILTILTVFLGTLCCSSALADSQKSNRDIADTGEISIWDELALNEGADVSEESLQTPSGTVAQEPIMVPLPAPLIAAGTGLGLAWLVRRRMTRS